MYTADGIEWEMLKQSESLGGSVCQILYTPVFSKHRSVEEMATELLKTQLQNTECEEHINEITKALKIIQEHQDMKYD